MAFMKTMTSVCIDVGKSMSESASLQSDSSSLSKLQVGVGIVSDFIVSRCCASKTPEFGVVTFGSSETNNELGYENVSEIHEIARPQPLSSYLQTINSLTNSFESNSQFCSGLVIAVHKVTAGNQGKNYNRHVLIITDALFELDEADADDIETTLEAMKKNEIVVMAVIVGSFPIDTVLRRRREQNIAMLNSIVQNTEGKLVTAETISEGLDVFYGIPGTSTKSQIKKWTLVFDSTCGKVPLQGYSTVMKASLPSFKKHVRGRKPSENPNPSGKASNEYGEVKTDKRYVIEEDPVASIEKELLSKAFRYGASLIPIDDSITEDIVKLKEVIHEESERCMTALGFYHLSRVPRHHYMESGICIMPHSDDNGSMKLMASLSAAMSKKGVGLLCRVKKTKSLDPSLGILIPMRASHRGDGADADDAGYEFDPYSESCMLLHRLPLEEDVRNYMLPSIINAEEDLSMEQRAAMDLFVDSISTTASVTVRDPILDNYIDVIKTSLMSSSTTTKSLNAATATSSKRKENAQPPVRCFDHLSATETSTSSHALHQLLQSIPIHSKKASTASVFSWGDVEVPTAFHLSSLPQDLAETLANLDMAPQHPRLSRFSIDPENDLLAVINCATNNMYLDSEFTKSQYILENLDSGFQIASSKLEPDLTEQHHNLGATILFHLRSLCIQYLHTETYNEFVKDFFPSSTSEEEDSTDRIFDKYIVLGGPEKYSLGLITADESVTSTVTTTEANSFLTRRTTIDFDNGEGDATDAMDFF